MMVTLITTILEIFRDLQNFINKLFFSLYYFLSMESTAIGTSYRGDFAVILLLFILLDVGVLVVSMGLKYLEGIKCVYINIYRYAKFRFWTIIFH